MFEGEPKERIKHYAYMHTYLYRGVCKGFEGRWERGCIVTAVHLYMSEVELELALGTEYGNRTMAVYVSSVLAGVLLLPRARMPGRGRVISQFVYLFVCFCVCVCPPLFALFRHLQELIQPLAGRLWRKNSF